MKTHNQELCSVKDKRVHQVKTVKYCVINSTWKGLRQATVVTCYKASQESSYQEQKSHVEDWDGQREQEKLKKLVDKALVLGEDVLLIQYIWASTGIPWEFLMIIDL